MDIAMFTYDMKRIPEVAGDSRDVAALISEKGPLGQQHVCAACLRGSS